MVHNNYSNVYSLHRDKGVGAFGKPASKERIELANNVNKLGDALAVVFPRSVAISLRGTVSMGLVYRLEKFYVINSKRAELESVLKAEGYEIIKEDRYHIYLKKL